MPVTPTYPGVYIEEIPSGVRTISGVATSIAAFVGYFSRGPMNEAVRIFSFGDFERLYGGLRADSEASYAIQQFFQNGGTDAWVVRVAGAGAAAGAIAMDDTSGTRVLEVTAANEGVWGNDLRVEIDRSTSDPTASFNLRVSDAAGNSEIFRNLVMSPTSSRHVVDVVNDGSKMIQAALIGTPTTQPVDTGTTSAFFGTGTGEINLASLAGGESTEVSFNGGAGVGIALGGTPPATPAQLAAELQALIRGAIPELSNATVAVLGSAATQRYLQIRAGTGNPQDLVELADSSGGNTLAGTLVPRANVQQYVLGRPSVAFQSLPGNPPAQQAGNDGALPGYNELRGNEAAKQGMFALLDVDLFNILCIPDTVRLPDTEAFNMATDAIDFCEEERIFYILDVPHADATRDEVPEIQQWLDDNAGLRHRNAALYFPRPMISDPLNDFRLRKVAPSGTLAGLYARTDGDRGVWKAPAGTEAALRGVHKLEYKLTDAENGVLNPLAINALRTFPVYGHVSWGARTLDGADAQASEWKYVPVRRVALFLEESLFRGLQWVVFEPNDESLWAQIRLNVGAFMQRLFLQGAFQGTSPREAYFVKCDAETTTQDDIDRGIVNIVVGFASLKPAEFVIIKIQQIAGQLET